MTKLEKYTKQHTETVAAMKAILDEAGEANEDGALSAEQQKQWDVLEAKKKTLAGSMKREAATEEAERFAPAVASAPANGDPPVRVTGGEPRKRGQPFNSLGEQLVAIVQAGMGHAPDPRLFAGPSGASANVGVDGGFLIQKDFVPELMKAGFESGALASRCSKHEVSANSDGLEVPYVNETSRATGSRWGGVQVYRRPEAETVTATKPKIGLWEVRLEDLMGLAYLTDRLSQDAPAMEGVFREAFVDEFGFVLDDEIFRGSGVGRCLGVLNAGAMVSIAKEAGQLAKTIQFENVSKMFAAVLPRSKANGAWFINTEINPQLQQMQVGTGTTGQLVYMPPGGVSGAQYATLFGRPIIEIEQASALGDVGDIAFLDLSQYKLVSKGGIQQEESIHVRFIYGEKTLRWLTRVNGAPKLKTSITPYKGAQALSPFVTLAAR
jgi:HK97 family phage major capsid protein